MEELGITPEFIAALYEAVFEPDGLMKMAHLLSNLLKVDSAGIWMVENGLITDIALAANIVESMPAYLSHFHKLDVWNTVSRRRIDHVNFGSETIPDRELEKTGFSNDFARHFGLTNPMGAVMQIARGTTATIGLERIASQQPFDESDRKALQALIPHFKRALQLRLKLRNSSSSPSQTLVLEALSFGAIICNSDAGIVYANAAAEAIFQRRLGLVFKSRQKTIGTRAAAENQKLLQLIYRAATSNASGSVVLTNSRGVRSLIVLATPMPRSPKHDLGSGHAMLAVRSLEAQAQFDAARLIQLFGLSPAQAALAMQLYEGKSFDEIAIKRGVKVTTLRTHYAEILSRTGSKGLRDLVRMLGMIPPLL